VIYDEVLQRVVFLGAIIARRHLEVLPVLPCCFNASTCQRPTTLSVCSAGCGNPKLALRGRCILFLRATALLASMRMGASVTAAALVVIASRAEHEPQQAEDTLNRT
jgi:hypothetical protein